MSFISLRFLIFLLVVVLVYYAIPWKKYQWVVLLAASYLFYLLTQWRSFAYILVTTLSTYGAARWMDYIQAQAKAVLKENKQVWDKEQKKAFKAQTEKRTHRILVLGLVFNFGILFLLKFGMPLARTAGGLFGFSAPTLRILLPLGISFYTFQSMGYLVDVCRQDTAAEKNLGKLALFVSFFPQILQGPISRYDQLAPQLYAEHRPDYTRIKHGLELMLWGWFKKLVIADRAAVILQTVLPAPHSFAGGTLAFTVVVYALQLYADFSAGIDITRAVAQMLGIDMIQNFRQPYFAASLTEYWNRWHISLGAWMKNYVFYPIALSRTAGTVTRAIKASRLGSSKFGAHMATVFPGTVASLIIFLIVGIWHGTGWRYILYGLWNGGIIMLSMLFKPCFDALNRLMHIDPDSAGHRLFRILRTFILVCIGNITDLAWGGRECFRWLRRIVLDFDFFRAVTQIKSGLGLSMHDYNLLILCTLLLYIVGFIRETHPQEALREILDRQHILIRWLLIFLCIVAILVFGCYGSGYSAAEFAYMQF